MPMTAIHPEVPNEPILNHRSSTKETWSTDFRHLFEKRKKTESTIETVEERKIFRLKWYRRSANLFNCQLKIESHCHDPQCWRPCPLSHASDVLDEFSPFCLMTWIVSYISCSCQIKKIMEKT
jgi:hypothetical protein